MNIKIIPFVNPSGTQSWRVYGRTHDGHQVRLNFTDIFQAVLTKTKIELALIMGPKSFDFADTPNYLDQQLPVVAMSVPPIQLAGPTIQEACTQFLNSREQKKLRPSSIRDYESRLRGLLKKFSSTPVTAITKENLDTQIFKKGQAARTANGNRRVLYTFFKWAIRQGFVDKNPCERIERVKVEAREPHILTLAEVRTILNTAQRIRDGIMIPFITLGLFAGLRTREIHRLTWGHLDFDQKLARLTSDITKLRSRRLVTLADNLIAWLEPHYQKVPICPGNWRKELDKVRRAAGFRGSLKVGRGHDKDTYRKFWPENVLRHTALSYHFARWNDENKTASWAGNSPDVFHTFYRGLVTATDAAAYWELRPQ